MLPFFPVSLQPAKRGAVRLGRRFQSRADHLLAVDGEDEEPQRRLRGQSDQRVLVAGRAVPAVDGSDLAVSRSRRRREQNASAVVSHSVWTRRALKMLPPIPGTMSTFGNHAVCHSVSRL